MNCRFDFANMECFDYVPFANGVLTDEELKESFRVIIYKVFHLKKLENYGECYEHGELKEQRSPFRF